MDIADRARVLKFIGMLGSSFDAERVAAARMIEKVAATYKMTINEAIAAAHGGASTPPPNKPQQPPWAGDDDEEFYDIGLLAELRKACGCQALTPWELQFANDVCGRYENDYQLTEKQVLVIGRIVKKWKHFTKRTGGL